MQTDDDSPAAVLDRVRTWSQERQEDLARLALMLEAQDAAGHILTDAQVEQVHRIREEVRQGGIASNDEVDLLWKQCGL
jgi:hypothetical protein